MKRALPLCLFLLMSCNPELQQVGADENDVVKYFKIASSGNVNALGEGVLIIAHAGEKRILTYYIKNQNGYSHTDVTLKAKNGFTLDSVYSKTEACKLKPDFEQPDFFNYLEIEGVKRDYKLEILPREEAMGLIGKITC